MPLANTINKLRACLGGIVLALGTIGICVSFFGLILAEPFGRLTIGNWNGDAPQPTEAQYEAAVSRYRWFTVMPFFLLSGSFVAYGIYEARREKRPADQHIPTFPYH